MSFLKLTINTLLILWVMASSLTLTFAQVRAANTAIEFKDGDKIINRLPLDALDKIASAQSLRIYESHEKKERVYQVYSVQSLFDQIFGKDWKAADEIVFLCQDGYQPSIPVAKFLAYDAYFAFASADGSPFTLTNVLQNNEIVELGPLYLVWDNLKSRALLDEGASDMPYQVIGIELTSFTRRFPNLFPPTDASQEAQMGFLHFRKHCIACHTLNGQGGGKAPELNYPVSVTEYIKPNYLRRWIDNPSSIRYNTTMPALAAETPERASIIEEIIAYLKVMSKTKRLSAETSE